MHDDEKPDPHMQTFAATVDICDYIATLPEPQKSICRAMVIEDESPDNIASRFNVTPREILRRTRKALAPLAMQYDIRNATKYLPVSKSVIRVRSDGKVTAHPAGAIQLSRGGKVGEGSKTEKVLPKTVLGGRPLGK